MERAKKQKLRCLIKMKKIIKKVSVLYIMLVFGLSPLLILFMYFTYTEKIVAPVLLITLLIAGITLKKVGI